MPDALPTRGAKPWPFMSPPDHHDSQITEHGVGVPARQEVQFKDGNRVWLCRVMVNGTPDLFLRDVGSPPGARIDLRRMLADIEKELPTTSTRDVAGYVAVALRLKFATADAFLEAVAA